MTCFLNACFSECLLPGYLKSSVNYSYLFSSYCIVHYSIRVDNKQMQASGAKML